MPDYAAPQPPVQQVEDVEQEEDVEQDDEVLNFCFVGFLDRPLFQLK
jgi:hypothetical protein